MKKGDWGVARVLQVREEPSSELLVCLFVCLFAGTRQAVPLHNFKKTIATYITHKIAPTDDCNTSLTFSPAGST